MATNPYTVVDAINQIVEAINEFPMSGSTRPSDKNPADLSSIYWRAETYLDRAKKQLLAQGWPENSERGKLFTPVSNAISMSGVLACKGSGPDHYRSLVIRNNALYDADLKVATFSAAVYLDVVVDLTWENLPLRLADLCIANARMLFQRRLQGSQLHDTQLQQEYIAAELRTDRNQSKQNDVPPNLRPIFPTGGQQQQGEGGQQ